MGRESESFLSPVQPVFQPEEPRPGRVREPGLRSARRREPEWELEPVQWRVQE